MVRYGMMALFKIIEWLAELTAADSAAADTDAGFRVLPGPETEADAALGYALSGLDPTGDTRVDYNLYEEFSRQLKN